MSKKKAEWSLDTTLVEEFKSIIQKYDSSERNTRFQTCVVSVLSAITGVSVKLGNAIGENVKDPVLIADINEQLNGRKKRARREDQQNAESTQTQKKALLEVSCTSQWVPSDVGMVLQTLSNPNKLLQLSKMAKTEFAGDISIQNVFSSLKVSNEHSIADVIKKASRMQKNICVAESVSQTILTLCLIIASEHDDLSLTLYSGTQKKNLQENIECLVNSFGFEIVFILSFFPQFGIENLMSRDPEDLENLLKDTVIPLEGKKMLGSFFKKESLLIEQIFQKQINLTT